MERGATLLHAHARAPTCVHLSEDLCSEHRPHPLALRDSHTLIESFHQRDLEDKRNKCYQDSQLQLPACVREHTCACAHAPRIPRMRSCVRLQVPVICTNRLVRLVALLDVW